MCLLALKGCGDGYHRFLKNRRIGSKKQRARGFFAQSGKNGVLLRINAIPEKNADRR